MTQLNIHEVKTKLLAKGKKDNVPIAKLVSIKTQKKKRKLGGAEGKIKIADDFNGPLDDFKEYI